MKDNGAVKSWEVKIAFQTTDAERERIERRLLDSRLFCSSGWFRHLFSGRLPGVKCKEFFFASSGPVEITEDEDSNEPIN